MPISELRRRVRTGLVDFAWEEWGQMGVAATSHRRDTWAADPEALLLFTFEIARGDARLFDEVLDWLLLNERIVSVQRLRNLCRDEIDRDLVEASLGWVAQWRPRARLIARKRGRRQSERPVPLFRHSRLKTREPDDAFSAYGWLKPRSEPSHKSQHPDLFAPINFSFRLRHLVGVGARAEVIRVLLTSSSESLTAQAVTESAGYAKRNVYDALTSLAEAGVIDALEVRNERRYGVRRERWAPLLGIDADNFPGHRAWPQLFDALRMLMRWLEDDRHQKLSDYMLASESRVLMDQIGPELRLAGVSAHGAGGLGADYWPDFVVTVDSALAALTTSS